jgi:hypothetical protein
MCPDLDIDDMVKFLGLPYDEENGLEDWFDWLVEREPRIGKWYVNNTINVVFVFNFAAMMRRIPDPGSDPDVAALSVAKWMAEALEACRKAARMFVEETKGAVSA